MQTVSVYLKEEISLRLSPQFSFYPQDILSTHTYQLHSYPYTNTSMSAQETIKDGANGGEGEGKGACTSQGCQCPAFTGNASNCSRGGCGHGYNQRMISDT